MSFTARELEPDNPYDIAAAAKKSVKKLDAAETPIEFEDFYNRYFDETEPKPVVVNACQALINHDAFAVNCYEAGLYFEGSSDIPEYCNLLTDIVDEFYDHVPQNTRAIPPP